jgi:hypothetical protein
MVHSIRAEWLLADIFPAFHEITHRFSCCPGEYPHNL